MVLPESKTLSFEILNFCGVAKNEKVSNKQSTQKLILLKYLEQTNFWTAFILPTDFYEEIFWVKIKSLFSTL